ncbi:MAG TPA: VTT domain-containing protein [Symbiobacteriaceae bacterium]|nr:VTT domain-containing protein [Symbiobacteriaceae bacterium]
MILEIIFSGGGTGSLISGVLEGLGVPWPGAVVVTTAGANHPGLQGAAIIATLFAAAYTIGSAAQYAAGRFCRNLLERYLPTRVRNRLERAMAKYGHAAVLWTRPLAVGNYISIPAGMMRMNPIKFTVYTFMGIWPWAFGMAAFGNLLTQYLDYASAYMPYAIALMVVWALVSGGRMLWEAYRDDQEGTFGD